MATILLTANTTWYIANFRMGLIRALQAREHAITVLAPLDQYADVLEKAGCKVMPLQMDNKGTSPVRDAKLLLAVWQKLRANRPDAALSFTVKNNIYVGLAARTLGIPFLPNVSGLGTGFSSEPWVASVVSLLSRAAFRPLPMVIFQNEDDRAAFVARNIVSMERTQRVAGSGVDLMRFSPAPLPNGAVIVFLLVARLLWEKGVGEFVEAARRLRAEGVRARYQLLGFLDVDNRGAIDRATVEAWQAEGLVEYLGTMDDVRPAIAGADCMVLPSFYREGVPRSLLEGAAMGRPVITTDASGCRDVVADGESGFLCKPRDVDSLTAAMRRMAQVGTERRQKMGQAARERMERVFDERLVIKTYLDWVETQLRSKSPRGGGTRESALRRS